jgi:hypothetical protein
LANLTLTLENELALLNKYSLTPNELMLIRTLLILQDDFDESLFIKFFDTFEKNKINLKELLISLQNKGVILKSYQIGNKGSKFNPYEIPFNKAFTLNLFRAASEMGEELYNAYPQFACINNTQVGIRHVASKFNSTEECYFRYGKEIKWNPDLHKKIIELVNWAKEFNIINCSLANFIINRAWEDLAALKDGQQVNINYENIRLL